MPNARAKARQAGCVETRCLPLQDPPATGPIAVILQDKDAIGREEQMPDPVWGKAVWTAANDTCGFSTNLEEKNNARHGWRMGQSAPGITGACRRYLVTRPLEA